MSKKEVKLKGVMDINQVASYLEDLAVSLKQGKVCVRQGEQFVTLCPDQMVEMEVKASAKKGKEKFEMELVWQREEVLDKDQEMSISANEPEPEAEAEVEGPLSAVGAPGNEVQPGADSANTLEGDKTTEKEW